jgi:hypothetical protein
MTCIEDLSVDDLRNALRGAQHVVAALVSMQPSHRLVLPIQVLMSVDSSAFMIVTHTPTELIYELHQPERN